MIFRRDSVVMLGPPGDGPAEGSLSLVRPPRPAACRRPRRTPAPARRVRERHGGSVAFGDCHPEVAVGLLDGRNALIFGVANDHSIAWGIAQALHAEGATLGFSSVESLIETPRPAAGGPRSGRRSWSRATSRTTRRSSGCSRAGARSTARSPARHPRPCARVRPPRGPRRQRSSTPRATASGSPSTSRVLARRPGARGAPGARPGLERDHADLLRCREGRRQLQRDGRGQGRARGVACATSPRTSARTASASTRSAPGRCARWPRPASPASSRCTAQFADVDAAALEHHDRGRRRDRRLPRVATSRAR